ncbi:MAG: dicarboxylate/amino acid:cation symporter [Treponemataceae bacterium]
MKKLFNAYLKVNLIKRILIALVLGTVAGIILGFFPNAVDTYVNYVQFFGDVFIRLLKMIVVPVVLFSIICGSASIEPAKLGRIGVKIILFYLFTSALAVVIGLLFANILKPGYGFEVVGSEAVKTAVKEAPSLKQVLLQMIPTNPIAAMTNGDMLPIIFFAMFFGFAVSYIRASENEMVRKSGDIVFLAANGSAEAMYKIVSGIMQYAPIGVFALISIVFAQQGPKAIGALLMVTVCIYLGFITQLVVCYGSILAISKINPIQFFKKINEIMVTAFVTRSSSGTLPITMRVSEEKLQIPRSISAFTLPLGATINMNGTAIYLGVCAMFIGYAIGSPLSLSQQIMAVVTATLAAIGTAGVPGSGPIMLLMVLDSAGLKLTEGSSVAAAYAMILGIDAILDMGRTCINVTGDVVCTLIVSNQEKKYTEKIEAEN